MSLPVSKTIQQKQNHLKRILSDIKSALVAFSGGVDSSFLLKNAKDVLGDKVLAVTAVSAIRFAKDCEDALGLAKALGVRHRVVETDELSIPQVALNDPKRCYYCKRYAFSSLLNLAKEEGLNFVVDGSNMDDTGQYRPGLAAIEELGVRSPLQEAGLTKEEIRVLSREMNLPTWNKFSQACLLTRVPYNTAVKMDVLSRVQKAEDFLRLLRFSNVRVRVLEAETRIEVAQEQILALKAEECWQNVLTKFKALGFDNATLDPRGYRSGSMDESLGKSVVGNG